MLGIVFSKAISGGQTGVDRAALDVALELGIPCGGWYPKGRKAEDGPIDPKYPLLPYLPELVNLTIANAIIGGYCYDKETFQ